MPATTVTADQIEALRRHDSCTLATAIDSLKIRLRNEGYTNPSVRCMTPRSVPMVGHAVTLKIRCSNPQAEGHAYMDRDDWLDYLRSVPAPRVVVIHDADEHPGTGAFPGEIRASIWRALGCIGAITNGSVHDLPAIQKADFHLFARGLTVSHAYAHIVDFGRPVEVGGLIIQSGELLHGDVHGVLSIPVAVAPELPSLADRILHREREILEHCRSPHFSMEKVRELLNAPLR